MVSSGSVEQDPVVRLASEIYHHLPMLRRYARAVTGSQTAGDDCVALMLERLGLSSRSHISTPAKIALYRELADCLTDFADTLPSAPLDLPARHLRALAIVSRQAMLLTSLEGLTAQDAAAVLRLTPTEFHRQLEITRQDIGKLLGTDVLIIEDEFLISRDLARIVGSLGHRVMAHARTHAEARSAIEKGRPGLVLADVHLADGSSGIDAVTEIVDTAEVPVIFITAYPDRLLTGLRPEPTFLIAKPYRVEEVKAVIVQSLFFDQKARLRIRPMPSGQENSVPNQGGSKPPAIAGQSSSHC